MKMIAFIFSLLLLCSFQGTGQVNQMPENIGPGYDTTHIEVHPQNLRSPSMDIWVTNGNDSGFGSLRQAILDANQNGGNATIKFNIAGNATIYPDNHLWISAPNVTVDGTTQSGGYVTMDFSNTVFTTSYWPFVMEGSGSSVKGIYFSNLVDPTLSAFTGAYQTNNITIDNCWFTGFGNVAITTDGSQNCEIKNCTFGISPLGSSVGINAYGVFVYNSSSVNVSNNTFGNIYDGSILATNSSNVDVLNNSIGECFGCGIDTTGLYFDQNENVLIENNIINLNQDHGYGIYIKEGNTNVQLIQNDVSNCNHGVYLRNNNGTVSSEYLDIENTVWGIILKNSENFKYENLELNCVDNPFYYYDSFSSYPTQPYISIASTSQIAGTSDPFTSIDIYSWSGNTCGPCQGNNYIGSATTDALGNWTYTGNLSGIDHVIAIASNSTQSSQYSNCMEVDGTSDCYDPSIITGNNCPQNYEPVCGCDGNTYSNSCHATEAGITSFTQGVCGDSNSECTVQLSGNPVEKRVDLFGADIGWELISPSTLDRIEFKWKEKGTSTWKMDTIYSDAAYVIADGSLQPYPPFYFGCVTTFEFRPPSPNIILDALKPDTEYEVQMQAFCPNGNSAWRSAEFKTEAFDSSNNTSISTSDSDYNNSSIFSSSIGSYDAVLERLTLNGSEVLNNTSCEEDICVGCYDSIDGDWQRSNRWYNHHYSEILVSEGNNQMQFEIAPDTIVKEYPDNTIEIDTVMYAGFIRIWLDIDDDKVFEASELIYDSPEFNTIDDIIANFNIQNNWDGLRRMRVIYQAGDTPPQPYGYYHVGFTYDFDVTFNENCPANPYDLLCEDWVQNMSNYEELLYNSVEHILIKRTWPYGFTAGYTFYNCQGDSLHYCTNDDVTYGPNNPELCSQYYNDILSEAISISDFPIERNCELTCEPTISSFCESLSFLNEEDFACADVACTVVGGLLGFTEIYYAEDANGSPFYIHRKFECLDGTDDYYTCHGEPIGIGDLTIEGDSIITYLFSYSSFFNYDFSVINNKQLLWDCSMPIPNCNSFCESIASSVTIDCSYTFNGNTTEGFANANGYNCFINLDNKFGPEQIVEIIIDEETYFDFSSSLQADQSLFILGDCDPDSDCIFNTSGSSETIVLSAGTYYVVVDGTESSGGAYSWSLECTDQPCGIDPNDIMCFSWMSDSLNYYLTTYPNDCIKVNFFPSDCSVAFFYGEICSSNLDFEGNDLEYCNNSTYSTIWDCSMSIPDCLTAPPWEIQTCNSSNNQSIILDRQNDRFTADIAGAELDGDDWIGVFYTDEVGVEHCMAADKYSDEESITALVVCGDDPLTDEKDGFVTGESFIYRVWKDGAEIKDVKSTHHEINAFGFVPTSFDAFVGGSNQSYLKSIKRKVTLGQSTCEDPTTLGCEEITDLSNNLGKESEVNQYCISDNYVNGPEVYFEFENDALQDVKIAISNLTEDLELYILNEDCNSQNCIALSENEETEDEVILLRQLQPGKYFVVVDGYIDAVGNFDIDIECGDFGGDSDDEIDPDPDQDDDEPECKILTCGSNRSCTTKDKPNQVYTYGCSPNRFNGGGENIFTFTNSESKWVFITMTPEAGVNLDLFVLRGLNAADDCVTQSTEFADAVEGVKFYAQANKKYYVIVDGYNEDEGDFTLNVAACVDGSNGGGDDGDDPGDPEVLDCSDIEEVTCGVPITGTNATGIANVLFWGQCNSKNNTGKEVMYKFNNPETQQVLIELKDLQQNLNLFVLNECNSQTCIGKGGTKGRDRFNTQDEAVIYPALPAGEYIIVIDGVDGAESSFTLSIDCENTSLKCLEIDLMVGDNGRRDNLISTCYLPADHSVASIMNEYKGLIASVRDDKGNAWTTGDPNSPFDEWNPMDAYNIILYDDVTQDTTIEICGTQVDTSGLKALTAKDVQDRFKIHYLGYPFEESRSILDAFADTEGLNAITRPTPNGDQTHVFISTQEPPFELTPGEGYAITSFVDRDISYRNIPIRDNGCSRYLMPYYGSSSFMNVRVGESVLNHLNLNRGDEIAIVDQSDNVISSAIFDGYVLTLLIEGNMDHTVIDEGMEINEVPRLLVWRKNVDREEEYRLEYQGSDLTYNRGRHIDVSLGGQISSISIVEDINHYEVYPNPFNSEVSIFGDFHDLDKINVIDMNGKLVRVMDVPTSTNSVTLDLYDISSGVYMIQIISSEGITNKKVIKQ